MKSRRPHLGAVIVLLALMLIALMPTSRASAQSAPLANARSPFALPQTLTGKERLGGKWTDEQRIDNCKVPPDKRGAKPRPEGCPPTS